MRISIHFKIAISILTVALSLASAILILIEYRNDETVQLLLDVNIQQGRNIILSTIEDQKRSALKLAQTYANDESIKETYLTQNRELLTKVLLPIYRSLNDTNGLTVFELGDSKGAVFLRGHNPEKFGDDKSADPAISAALEGRDIAGFIFGNSGLAIRAIVPIRDGTDVVGTLQVGFNLNKELLANLSRLVGDIAFFEKDLLIQSTSDDELEQIQKYTEKKIYEELTAGETIVIKKNDTIQSTFLPMLHPVSNHIQGMFRLNQDLGFLTTRKSENQLFLIVIFSLGMTATLMVSFMVSSAISKPIKRITRLLNMIFTDEGSIDLTQKIEINSKDEIAEMAHILNSTFDKIRHLVSQVRSQTGLMKNIGTGLSTNMTETAATINEIAANIQSIRNQTLNQSASVSETSATMEQITKGIEKLNSLIENQAANVTESSAAIEQILANIGSVTQTLFKNSDNIRSLTESSESGKNALDMITVSIREVAKESEGLMEISQLIQSIASQTNLLSMNAAIEAAHAGDSGKGFAVVADEIRRLAETSNEQTKTIYTVLKRIQDSITGITRASEEVLAKFTVIEREVKTVGEQESAIRQAMEEQGEGGKQVLESISILNDITQKVQLSSLEMLTGSEQVTKEALNMNAITQEITGGISEMASGTNQMAGAVNTINELSLENKRNIDALIVEVGKFKV